ncbi:hypothetical protein IPZ68_05755 [Streptomyces arenae]|nr:hypothetical protein [Streptomyces arenae]
MVMTEGLMAVSALVMIPFLLACVRHVVMRRRRTGSGVSAGAAAATEELHAFLNANKRVQLEHRQEQLVLRDETLDGAPPRMGIDLDSGRAVVRKPGEKSPAP